MVGRRIVFLHYILCRPRTDLLSQVFYAQLENPVKNDWSEQIKEDLKEANLEHLTFDDIKAMNRDAFKKLVREKIRGLALKKLLVEKEKMSKMRHLQYDELKLQSYLSSGKLNTGQKKLLFKLRVRMVMTPDNMGKTQPCRLCGLARDEMSHPLVCLIVKLACPDVARLGEKVNISDAYGDDEDKMKTLAVVYQKAWRTRERLLTKLSAK